MKQQLSEAQFCCYFIWLNVFVSFNSHFPCAPPVTDGYMLQQVGVPPSHPPPLLSTFSSKTPWEHGTGTDLLPRAQVLPSTQPHIHTSRYHTVCKTRWHQCRLFFLLCWWPIHSGGFGMGSRSATTSPTGSVHSTPTHQTKPNTLDPFADIGNLGASLGGETLVMLLSS